LRAFFASSTSIRSSISSRTSRISNPVRYCVVDGVRDWGQSENFACGPVTDVVHYLQFGKSRDTILSTRDLSKKRKRRRGRAFETSPETSPCGKIGRANSLIPRLCLVKKVRRRREHDRTEYVARKKIV
jgi:hypothetical protein